MVCPSDNKNSGMKKNVKIHVHFHDVYIHISDKGHADDMSSVGTILLAVSLLMDLESRGKNERVGRVKRKRMVPKFKVLGQPLTSRFQFNDLSCHANMQS